MQLSYRWVIIGAGAVMTCVAAGAMFSLAVFLQPMSLATGWSRAGISSAMTLNFLTMGIAGFVWGSLSDRFGVRIVVLCGAVLLGLALVLASQATSLTQFQLSYGILVGFSAGALFAPLIAAATDPSRAGWGRLSEVSSENCPWVRPRGRSASSNWRAILRAARCTCRHRQRSRILRVVAKGTSGFDMRH